MSQYQGYLFDLDGTLVDTAPDLQDALNHVLNKAGLPSADLDLTREWIGFGGRVMIAQAMNHLQGIAIEEATLDSYYQEFVSSYTSQISLRSQPYPHVVEVLEKLYNRTYRLGVVSNKFERLCIQLLEELKLDHYFNIIVGGDTLQVAKPEPEPLLYACNELDLEPKKVLFVGDSSTDVNAARNAGCPVYIHAHGYHDKAPSELGADKVFQSFAELA